MITAGIDVGIENIKAVLLKDGKVVARGKCPSGGAKRGKEAEKIWQEMLEKAGVSASGVNKVIATGQGKTDVAFANDRITEPVADARAARFLFTEAASVVDIGADQVRVVTLGEGSRITEVVMNQKCAAGLGIFLKSMARTLGMTLEEMGGISVDPPGDAVVNDGCAVFAEMDALGLLNRNVPREEVARAVIGAVAVRVNSILNDKVKPAPDSAVLIGGVSRNKAVVDSLKRRSGIDFVVPEEAEYAGALGCALMAAD